jgi:hypothetical protein
MPTPKDQAHLNSDKVIVAGDNVFKGMVIAKLENLEKMIEKMTDTVGNSQDRHSSHLVDCSKYRSDIATAILRNQAIVELNKNNIDELKNSITRFYKTVIVLFTGILLSGIGLFFEKFLFKS